MNEKIDYLNPNNLPDDLGGPINAGSAEDVVERAANAVLIGEEPETLGTVKLQRHMSGATTAVLEYIESPFIAPKEGKEYNWSMESNIFIAIHTLPWQEVKRIYKKRDLLEDAALDIGLQLTQGDVQNLTQQILRVVAKEQQHQVVAIEEEKDIEKVVLGSTKGGGSANGAGKQ